MNIWYGDGDDDALSLGHTLETLRVFGELADILDEETGYDELQSVPGFAEQTVTPWWMQQVSAQAKKAMQEYGDEMSESLSATLGYLVEQIDALSTTRMSADDDRGQKESVSPAIDSVIDQGASAAVVISDEIRRRVRALAKKKYPGQS